jgi:hypothetical protein
MKQQQQSVNTCGATTISKTALIVMTLVAVTLSIKGFIETLLTVVILNHYAECCFVVSLC